jgi:hypothetical protein
MCGLQCFGLTRNNPTSPSVTESHIVVIKRMLRRTMMRGSLSSEVRFVELRFLPNA